MDLSHHTAALADDLTAAAALGDEQTQRTAAALASALEPAARLMLLSALSELAAEVTAALGDRVVEVRLDGRDVRVVTSSAPVASPSGPTTGAATPGARTFGREDLGGDVSRVTLRLVEQLKARAEQAASKDGISLNTWLSQAVQGALCDPGVPPAVSDSGQTLRGWVRG
ncbi:toxin-antitoxin system HicB family antitoxin [Rhodococcus sp. X156]|uniref:toxin-antitoxin system HicB family antitoxin n=1 Tax=Rhodococcus sp. X156 TaxID=2499145 RepID=UPI000FD89373|nr:toxin-antitoxin system HicB family antitoxin [Rhodococcus sp. X156]